MHESRIYICPMAHAGDTTEFRRLLDEGEIDVADIQGIMITHEGDLVANAYASLVYAEVLSERLGWPATDLTEEFPIQALAGAVGFMTPHAAIMTRREVPGAAATGEKRLAIAGTCTRRFLPEEVGTAAYINEIRDRVRDLYKELEVESPDDVGLVFCKTGWPGARHRADVASRGAALRSDDWWTSSELARGGAALGVGAALGEFAEDDLEKRLNVDAGLYSQIAQCSSTEERDSVAIIMFANTRASVSPTVIGRCVMKDGLDQETPRALAASLMGVADPSSDEFDLDRVEYGFLKPKTAEAPDLRGRRHTLKEHPAVGHMWWMIEKAPVHAAVAACLDLPVMEVATGPEHQGPTGRPLLSLVVRVDD
ncbi:MAG: ring-opening amidohydrolase [Actinomadura sp.]